MLKKTVTYDDFFGKKRTEDFYFHYNKAELLEMEMESDGGYSARVQRIANANSHSELFHLVKEFVLGAYGVKSDDGRMFDKGEKIRNSFERCPAYEIIMLELTTGPDCTEALSEFINKVVPEGMPKPDALPAAIPAAT